MNNEKCACRNLRLMTYNLRLTRHFDRSARGTSARSGEIPSPTQRVLERLRGIAGDSSTPLRSARNDGVQTLLPSPSGRFRHVPEGCRSPSGRFRHVPQVCYSPSGIKN
jgi:hypothetical protein